MQARLLHLDSYDYYLPEEFIAQHPVSPRDSSRLLVVSRQERSFSDHHFSDLPQLLQPGDLLILNNTRVMPARLQSNRGEVLLIREIEPNCWDAMVHPGKQFKPGTVVEFPGNITARVMSQSPSGRILYFNGDVEELLRTYGRVPLPPYIKRDPEQSDKRTYQTVYARIRGSVAAPTAGLHFTRRLLDELRDNGIDVAKITLHVGPGTFRPVKSPDITVHHIDPEYYTCSRQTWSKIQKAARLIAVGTTTTRALETIGRTEELSGYTNLFIYPGFDFQVIQGLVTNFHLPRSSLLMLISAFGGYDLMRRAYKHAIDSRYRFYSYGDAMVVL